MIPKSLERVIEALQMFPGIGEKTAQRFAYHITRESTESLHILGNACIEASKELVQCSICCTLSNTPICDLCEQPNRDTHTICVTESPLDMLFIERLSLFHGTYHILHGVLSPIHGITPEKLTIQQLKKRCLNPQIQEIIFALPPSLESEATIQYISTFIPPHIHISSLRRGLPSGSQLEYIDEQTLRHAFTERTTRS